MIIPSGKCPFGKVAFGYHAVTAMYSTMICFILVMVIVKYWSRMLIKVFAFFEREGFWRILE